MIPWGEVVAGIRGAWCLLRREPKGMLWFDDSAHGFITSFWAAVLVAPAFVLIEAANGTFEGEGWVYAAAIQACAYVVMWTAFPLLMASISEGLGRPGHWVRYVVAYNWSSVIQMAIFLPVTVLGIAFPGPVMAMLTLSVSVILLVYQAYVAHIALDIRPLAAAGVVMTDVLLGAFIKAVADRLMAG